MNSGFEFVAKKSPVAPSAVSIHIFLLLTKHQPAICSRDNCHPWPFGKHENFSFSKHLTTC